VSFQAIIKGKCGQAARAGNDTLLKVNDVGEMLRGLDTSLTIPLVHCIFEVGMG
jgi:hypothetical protein